MQPDRSVTGGPWYSDNDLESEFVEVLNQQCFKFLEQKVRCIWTFSLALSFRHVTVHGNEMCCLVQALSRLQQQFRTRVPLWGTVMTSHPTFHSSLIMEHIHNSLQWILVCPCHLASLPGTSRWRIPLQQTLTLTKGVHIVPFQVWHMDWHSYVVIIVSLTVKSILEIQKTAAKASNLDPISERNASLASSNEVWKFITEIGVSKVCLCTIMLVRTQNAM